MLYTVIEQASELSAEIAIEILVQEVQSLLDSGWQLSGGIAVAYAMPPEAPAYWMVMQAMTKAS